MKVSEVSCPVCGYKPIIMTQQLYSVPFFNEIAMFHMECPKCHFSHNDVFAVEQQPPARWTLKVKTISDLSIRVIRSSSGTFTIPEFGIKVEPGPAADSFISNVEGVLYRIMPAVEMAIKFAETDEAVMRGRTVLKMIHEAIEGKLEFTLIMEDPNGISSILPDDLSKVKYEVLTPEEASKLKGSVIIFDDLKIEKEES